MAKDPKAKKSDIITKADLICMHLKTLPTVSADLQYFLTLSEVLAGQVLLGLGEAPERFKAGKDLKSLYTILLQRFNICDISNTHPIVNKLKEEIAKHIEDKEDFIVQIIKQLLEGSDGNFSEKAIISMIQGQKSLDALKIAEGFMRSFSLSPSKPGPLDVSALFTKMWNAEASISV
jgi:hypothetical protein